jgi:hypothetical protein
MCWLHIFLLPAVLSPEDNHSVEHRVPSVVRAVSPPVIVTSNAATTITITHLVGSQKRKARKQCITRLDPENVRTSRGKLRNLDFSLFVFMVETGTHLISVFTISCNLIFHVLNIYLWGLFMWNPFIMLIADHMLLAVFASSAADRSHLNNPHNMLFFLDVSCVMQVSLKGYIIMFYTEWQGQVDRVHPLYVGDPEFNSQPEDQLSYVRKDLCGFLQSLQANASTSNQTMTASFTFFSFHYSESSYNWTLHAVSSDSIIK